MQPTFHAHSLGLSAVHPLLGFLLLSSRQLVVKSFPFLAPEVGEQQWAAVVKVRDLPSAQNWLNHSLASGFPSGLHCPPPKPFTLL